MRISQNNLVIEERSLRVGEKFILCKAATVRSLAKEERCSKSTVHKDLTERLREIDKSLYNEVRKKLDENKKERHLRGGEATRQKYLSLKQGRL